MSRACEEYERALTIVSRLSEAFWRTVTSLDHLAKACEREQLQDVPALPSMASPPKGRVSRKPRERLPYRPPSPVSDLERADARDALRKAGVVPLRGPR